MSQYVPDQKIQQSLTPDLKEPIELFIACNDLVKRDFKSKSDPFVAVSIQNSKTKQWKELGRTEVIYENHSPKCM